MSYDELADEDLLQACRAGHQGAWSTLVRRFQRLIYTVPRRAGLSDDHCADIFQVTFQRLHRHLDRIEDASRVRAWLVTTAKRETLRVLGDVRRHASSVASAAGSDDEDAADPLAQVADPAPLQEEQLSALQESHRLRRAVDLLDPASRQLVELLFLQEEALPYAEIARRLGMPEGSIGPTRARCLAKLRNLLQKV